MNYIIEINRFYDWLETNQMSKSAIALWHGLMHINNKTNWIDEFSVAMSVLEFKTGFKSSELYKARTELQDKKRLLWWSRNGNQSAIYKLIPFCVHTVEANVKTNSYTSKKTNAKQTNIINKLNNNKRNSSSDVDLLLNTTFPPNDSVKRNWEGLKTWLRNIKATEAQATEIILLSNYGEIGTPIWKVFSEITKSAGGIKQPVAFILSQLK